MKLLCGQMFKLAIDLEIVTTNFVEQHGRYRRTNSADFVLHRATSDGIVGDKNQRRAF